MDPGHRGDRNGGAAAYWRTNLRVLIGLLLIWFFSSFGLGILLVEPLNAIHIGGFPLGFWFAQQGSILIFIALILVYALLMDRVDARYEDSRRRDGSPDGSP